jgi:hypothetical protein
MSVYPTNLDTTFPGYPYIDFTENVTGDQANSWVEAIIATESTIGYGTPGTSQYPLYSSAYNITFPTVTARIAALEGIVFNEPKMNTADNVIQTVGTANQAGHTGLIADAGHVHQKAPVVEVPIGGMIIWPGEPATFPQNFGVCNGQAMPRGTYTALYNIIGYKYGGSGGTGPNWTNFLLPQMADLLPMGAGGFWVNDVGAKAGSSTLSASNMPQHHHTASDNGHVHGSYLDPAYGGGGPGPGSVFEGIYTAPGSSLSVPPTGPVGSWPGAPAGSIPVSWSPGRPGYPGDPGYQDAWAMGNASITVNDAGGTGAGTGSAAAYSPPVMGFWYLMRVI